LEKIVIKMAKIDVFTVIYTPVFAILMAIFPGGPVLASTRMCLLWILFHRRLMEMVVTAGDIKCAKLQSNDH